MHRRQRRVATPAFSVQNLRALVPVVFGKGGELRDRWMGLMGDGKGIRLDVNHWLSRATFDVIGLAGKCRHPLEYRILWTDVQPMCYL